MFKFFSLFFGHIDLWIVWGDFNFIWSVFTSYNSEHVLEESSYFLSGCIFHTYNLFLIQIISDHKSHITAVANSRLILMLLNFLFSERWSLLDNSFNRVKGVSLIIAFWQFTLHLGSVTALSFLPPRAGMLHVLDLTPLHQVPTYAIISHSTLHLPANWELTSLYLSHWGTQAGARDKWKLSELICWSQMDLAPPKETRVTLQQGQAFIWNSFPLPLVPPHAHIWLVLSRELTDITTMQLNNFGYKKIFTRLKKIYDFNFKIWIIFPL